MVPESRAPSKIGLGFGAPPLPHPDACRDGSDCWRGIVRGCLVQPFALLEFSGDVGVDDEGEVFVGEGFELELDAELEHVFDLTLPAAVGKPGVVYDFLGAGDVLVVEEL